MCGAGPGTPGLATLFIERTPMGDMPVCRACGRPHWRFVACADAPKERAATPAEAYPIKTVPEGYRPWGDKLSTRDRNGWLIPEKS